MKIGLNRNGRRALAAFTFAEVAMGVLIMAVAVVSLFTAFTQGFGLIRTARENLRATQILQDKLETARLYTWEQVTNGYIPATFSGTFCPSGLGDNAGITYTGTLTITNSSNAETYSADLKLLIFELNWTSGSVQRHRTMSTLVSRYGLHNYIYSYK
jgi:Tfp pilus assembly protein PilV